MATSFEAILYYCFSLFLIFTSDLFSVSADEDRKLYIVYMGSLKPDYSPSSHHLSLLDGVIKNSNTRNLLVRSYGRSFNGFAAMLSDSEAKQLQSSKEVISVFPSLTYQLQTTRSWSFLGFEEEITHQNRSAVSNVIIGVLDTGIWPESQSFNDEGFGPPPKKWKGSCKGGRNFTCNNKIIGAQYYTATDPDTNSARDDEGHGTHTASTAAGNKVKDANFFGIAKGVARGGVPSARIAAYKVCQPSGCSADDMLAAFDDAIADGVDIITISIGFSFAIEFSRDVIAIGAFHALEKGILTSHSAGNEGPDFGSVSSVAPWLLSVAAGSTDRRIFDKVILGNRKELIGSSVNPFDLKGKSFPLIHGSKARMLTPDCAEFARFCSVDCLNSSLVEGKIVVCDIDGGAEVVKSAGAVGAILNSTGRDDISFVFSLPAVVLSGEKYSALLNYLNSSRHPVAQILKSEEITEIIAPKGASIVASFSSRGPNLIVGDLLKPDIVAPGIDILAAYPPNVPPSSSPEDKRRANYNILSGTSMACPHAAAIAAYIKTIHPNWSPSAMKSAILTTAIPLNATTNSGAEFAYGFGGINPLRAIHPGLVYDAQKADYITFLCAVGYNDSSIRAISGDNSTCPQGDKKASPRDFNYPSLTARIPANKSFNISFPRTVTNVGTPKSTYKAEVSTTSKLKVQVVPNVLSFNSIDEKKSFTVTVTGGGLTNSQTVTSLSASLVWSDGRHIVRSPILVYTYKYQE